MKTQPIPEQVKKTLVLSIYFVLTLSTLLVFLQVCNFDFVSWDDNIYVFENQHVLNGLTADGVRWAFTTDFAKFWHPLTWLSLMLDQQIYGSNAGGYHFTNLLFHIVNTLLVFIVLKEMTNAVWQSAFAAALFALHPMHVESVAWVSERKDVLSTLFWLLTMLVYARYVKKTSAASYLLVLLTFTLGLMAKPMLITLPFVFLLLDYWPLNRIDRFNWKIIYSLVWEKIPFFVFSAVFSIITFLTQQSGREKVATKTFFLIDRVGNAFLSYAKYMSKMFWPQNLAVFYPFNAESILFWQVAICVLLLLVISVLVICFGRSHRYLAVGWFWFVGTLVPVIGVIRFTGSSYSDRFTYISYIGLFIMVAWGLPELLSKWPYRKFVLSISAVIVLTVLGICADRQVNYWNNNIALFSHAIEVTQNNYIMCNCLGAAYYGLGRYQEAIDAYKEAIKIEPNYADAYNNLGIAYENLGHYSEAIDALSQAIKIRPNYAETYYDNLGSVYSKLGRWQDAVDAYKQTIRIKPDYAETYNNLGIAYGNLGRDTEAIDAYKEAIKIKPDYAEAYYNLGAVCGKLGRSTDAIEDYIHAIKINPDNAEAYNNLGTVYLGLGRYQEAMETYREAIKIKPDFANAYYNLGDACGKLGRITDAIEAYIHAIKINPDDAEAYGNLGIAYSKLGRNAEAIEAYKEAIRIKPDYTKAHNNLGAAYLSLGRWREAIQSCKAAIRIRPDNAEAYNNLSVAYGNLGRYTEATEACKEAIRIKPDYAGAHYNLGNTYLKMGDKDSALAEYNILKSLNLQLANNLLNQINK